MNSPSSLTVYYDGACHLCSREIAHYQKRAPAAPVRYVDIAAPGFDAKGEGLDPVEVHRSIHVKLPSGKVVRAVDAFVELWRVLPGYGFFSKAARWPVVYPVLSVAYRAFASLRPYLPKRKAAACTNGSCSTQASTK